MRSCRQSPRRSGATRGSGHLGLPLAARTEGPAGEERTMLATVILRIIVTGIVAIVPSEKGPNLTRIIASYEVDAPARYRGIPEHFAFLDVPEENYVSITAEPSPPFVYLNPEDRKRHVVFLLDSETVELEKLPENTTLDENGPTPAKPYTNPTGAEKTSTFYAIHMAKVCKQCKIANDRFDVVAHPEKIAARMDLHGGREFVKMPHTKLVWKMAHCDVLQPMTNEVKFEFDVDASERLVLTPHGKGKYSGKTSYIALKGNSIDVTIGNAPFRGIMLLDDGAPIPPGHIHDGHFALIYDTFQHKYWLHHPIPQLISPPAVDTAFHAPFLPP